MEPFNVLTQARHGQVLYNRHDRYIGRALELYGEWSEAEIALCSQVLQPGMVVVDAGANIGTHTLPLARVVAPNGVVYAFEPQRIMFQTLAANVALNSLTNVVCLQRAVGEAPGIAWVPPLEYTTTNNFGGVELAAGATPAGVPDAAPPPGEPVEVMRIDDLNLAVCHLIKIDVEGMELAVLRGAAATIAQHQPLLYVEADRAEHRDAIVQWLHEHGYAMYWHQVPLYSPTNFKANPTNVFEGIVSLNLLALPASIPQTVAGLERVVVPGQTVDPVLRREPPVLRRPASGRPEPRRRPVARRTVVRSVTAPPRRLEPPSGPVPQHPHDHGHEHTHEHSHEPPPPVDSAQIRAALEQAVTHHQAGRTGEAGAIYEAILALQPDEPDALHLLGLVSREERQFDEALALLERAVAIMPVQPVFHFNLGAVRRQVGLLSEAEASLGQALALSPDSAEAHLELGLTLLDQRRLDEAEGVLRAGLALAPEHPVMHFALAGLLLLTGRFVEGWDEYAWRWRMPEMRSAEPAAQVPLWDGSPLDGRTILLEAEQGHGDTIQVARYVPLVAARGGRVLLRCRPEMQSLLGTLEGVTGLISPGQVLPPLDCVARLMDLPRTFGTTVETIPSTVPYLHADPARVQAWRAALDADDAERAARADSGAALGTRRPPMRVGLAWAGSPDHRQNGQRSTTLAALEPLAGIRGVRFYGLQKDGLPAESANPPAGLDFVNLAPALTDFAETAAVVSLLDLVITVDTSVGHLAGALGRPAWILPWATHDWRWLLGREDSPWYPTVRLFRQETPNDWHPVIVRVAEALREELGARR